MKVETGLTTLQTALNNTKAAVKPWGNPPVIVGETGWPTAGPANGAAIACKSCLEKYYASVACWLAKVKTHGWFWFSGFDEPQRHTTIEKNFGIAWSGQTPKVKFACPA